MANKLIAGLILSCSTIGGILVGALPLEKLTEHRRPLSKSGLQDPSATATTHPGTSGIGTSTGTSSRLRFATTEWEDPAPLRTSTTTLGVHVVKVDPALSRHVQIPEGTGLLIEHVVAGSGADKSNLRRFDILFKFDDQIVVNAEQLSVLVELRKPKSKVKLTIVREGTRLEIETRLQEKRIENPLGQFDAFYFFHGHRGRIEFQDCSVCHVTDRQPANPAVRTGQESYHNYRFFHGERGSKEFLNCSDCHSQVVYPLSISKSR